MKTTIVLLTVIGMAGCGGGKSKPSSGTKAATNVKFDDMTTTQKKEYMEHVVLPKMKPLFQKFDPEKFEQMNCETCHGDSAVDGSFEMPNPKIYILPTTPAGFGELAQKEPKWMEFMGKVVKPEMAKLLGEPEWTPETQKGFGCMECHTAHETNWGHPPEAAPPATQP